MRIRVNIQLATNWNELSERQLQNIAAALELYYQRLKVYKDEKDTLKQLRLYHRLHLAFIRILLSANNMLKTWYALQQIPPSEYLSFLKFLTEECQRTVFPKAIKLKGKLYHPPADRIQNLRMKEFSFADSLFYNWKRSGKEVYLDLLCATLYRVSSKSADADIDPRVSFEKIRAEKALPVFRKLKLKKKLAIAYAYEGSRNYVVNQYPHVFPKPPVADKNEDPEEDEQPAPEPKYTPFGKLIHHKIQFDPSKIDQVQNLNIHDFFGPYENELIELKNKPANR